MNGAKRPYKRQNFRLYVHLKLAVVVGIDGRVVGRKGRKRNLQSCRVVSSLVSNRCGCGTAGYREKKIFEEDVAEGLYTKWLVVPVQVPVPETAPPTCAAHHT